jgi:hypothetical protein
MREDIKEQLIGYVFELGSELRGAMAALIKAAPIMLILYVLILAPNCH